MFTANASVRYLSILLTGTAYLLGATDSSSTTITAKQEIVKLDTQVAQADYVVRGVVIAAELLEYRDGAEYLQCGTQYRLRIIEVYRGEFGRQLVFASHRPLSLGGDVLLLLQEGQNTTSVRAGTQVDREAASNSGSKIRCKTAWSSIILTDEREDVFPIVQIRGADQVIKEWLLFDDARTSVPTDMRGLILPACSLPSPGCDPKRPGAPWRLIREAIPKWISR
jgi:hypothetical protein